MSWISVSPSSTSFVSMPPITAATPGRVKAGSISVGDEVGLPEGRTSTVTQIDTADGPADSAATGDSVTLLLADDIDLARGDLTRRTPTPRGHPRIRRHRCGPDRKGHQARPDAQATLRLFPG